MCIWNKLVREEGWVRNWQLEFEMVYGHLKPKKMQGDFWQRLSSNPTTCFKQEAQISNPKTWSFCMGSGWVRNSLWISNSLCWFLNWAFPFHLWVWNCFELTQILNSAICDRVWTPRHIETSSKGLYPIQNSLYSIRTCNFWNFFRLFMIFFV